MPTVFPNAIRRGAPRHDGQGQNSAEAASTAPVKAKLIADKCLVITPGATNEMAESILETTGAAQVAAYHTERSSAGGAEERSSL